MKKYISQQAPERWATVVTCSKVNNKGVNKRNGFTLGGQAPTEPGPLLSQQQQWKGKHTFPCVCVCVSLVLVFIQPLLPLKHFNLHVCVQVFVVVVVGPAAEHTNMRFMSAFWGEDDPFSDRWHHSDVIQLVFTGWHHAREGEPDDITVWLYIHVLQDETSLTFTGGNHHQRLYHALHCG